MSMWGVTAEMIAAARAPVWRTREAMIADLKSEWRVACGDYYGCTAEGMQGWLPAHPAELVYFRGRSIPLIMPLKGHVAREIAVALRWPLWYGPMRWSVEVARDDEGK